MSPRAVKWVMTAVLVLAGCGQVGGTVDSSASSNGQQSSLGTALKLHFRRPASWTNPAGPRVHYWQVAPAGTPDSTWPGVPLTSEGNGWWGASVPGASSAHLVFDDNPAPQTADLFRAGEGWFDNGTWYDANPDAPVDAGVRAGLTVHFKKPAAWTNAGSPRVYWWNAQPQGVPTTSWPGELMTAEGEGWFRFTIRSAQSVSLVFDNNNQPQTADLSRASEGWYADGVWYDAKPGATGATDAGTGGVDGGYQLRDNVTILQAFDWYFVDPTSETASYTQQPTPESNLWEYIAAQRAEDFYGNYFTHVWLPPTGKAFSPVASQYNVGYAVYDHYDLGEFNQMSHTRTKYGTKAQLLAAVQALHARRIKVVADVVMNHMLGTDNAQTMSYAFAYDTQKGVRQGAGTVTAYLDFDFKNAIDPAPRGTTHSSFHWVADHFTGMENYGTYYLFQGKTLGAVNDFKDLSWADAQWNSEYQYLRSDIILGADLDLAHPAVAQELVTWSKWLTQTVGFDGFRVDAVRHMHLPFVASWATQMRAYMGSIGKGDALVFGENWDGWDTRLNAYLVGAPSASNHEFDVSRNGYAGINQTMSLFDVPLHYAFQKVAGDNVDWLDIKDLPSVGLVSLNPQYAVTFVDNHDTLPAQQLASYIDVNLKLQAYAYILLNERGTPCVFYRDLYQGNYLSPTTNDHVEYLHTGISQLLEARAKYAYGAGSYYGAPGLLGGKRAGDGRGHSGGSASGVIYLLRQFDHLGHPTSGNTTLTIPDDGRNWVLFSGAGSRSGSSFSLADGARYAVWVPAN